MQPSSPFATSIRSSRGNFAQSARERGESLNTTVLRLLRDAVGLDARRERLRRYVGWTADDLGEFTPRCVPSGSSTSSTGSEGGRPARPRHQRVLASSRGARPGAGPCGGRGGGRHPRNGARRARGGFRIGQSCAGEPARPCGVPRRALRRRTGGDRATVRYYARIFASLRRAGTPIPVNDVWIAAATMECNGHLPTFDRDFRRIADLDHTLLEVP